MRYLLSAAIVAALTMSCQVIQFGQPSNTILYNKQESPWSASGPVGGEFKVGKACAMAWGFYVPFAIGDASVEKAARKGGIREIHSVSYELTMSHFTQDWCTVVTGI